MPSVFSNASSDYLPPEGFTQGGQGSLKNIAKLARKAGPDFELLHHPELPEIQYYASNAVLACKYVSPLVEDNLEGVCPMLIVSSRVFTTCLTPSIPVTGCWMTVVIFF